MVGAVESWVRQGRVSGIGVMLIDQRAASVNKDVLSQVEPMVAHRHTGPQDRAALKAWVQAHATPDEERTFMDSLASLARGEAWFWSPEWLKQFERVQVRPRRTFDSSATPGQARPVAAPKKVAAVELDKLKAKLARTIDEARQNDPAALRREIAELKRRAAAGSVVPSARVERVEVPVVGAAELTRLEAANAQYVELLAKVAAVQDRLGAMVDALAAAIAKVNPASHPPPQSAQPAAPSSPPRQVIHRPSTRPAPASGGGGARA